MRQVFTFCSIIALTGFSPQNHKVTPEVVKPATAGLYKLDPAHASLIFKVNHMGLSNYTARFKNFDAQLEFDPNNPSASKVNATIEVGSLETDFPRSTPNFNAQLQNPDWLNVVKFPKIMFRSTKVTPTGAKTARITGELNLHGVTHPVTLEATFNGGYASHPYDPLGSRIGFSAHGSFKRSEFGITQGIPAKGSTMGVGDKVEVIIEAEFTKPVTAAKLTQKPKNQLILN